MPRVLLEVLDAHPADVVLPAWAQWVTALGPAVTFLAAVLAALIAVATLRQRRRADDKAEWWRRTQWALERALEPDDEPRAVGAAMLKLLATSELAKPEDLDLHQAAWDALLQDVPEDVDAYQVEEDGDEQAREGHQDAGGPQGAQ